ncbi:aminotransferase class III-fold pyridoxal phosphate-dependent enzyme [Labilibaculum sp. 44]|uniref:Aminotransferase class III-fold pyridoxal phosphate-dependent enzyme n=1 Tax=Labilibaculum euxinus TaxID=2686357 RepID=A0A7M4D252_9BACT|nr:aminotransferase class III-fold pyridoxal phosphate-dependent enzyme [Labilibaculum euxinus]MVB05936.1 aminotransferase class III-fold pyridoxal phosphate-dependent enzyme [Labilibaculum euxinus]
MTNRQLFLQHVATTSDFPIALEIERAEGIYMYSPDGKPYLDLVSGVSVSNLGHGHPRVRQAIKDQVDKYMHLMVYGEFIESPQVQLAKLLSDNLPESLNSVYFVNSGSEANEGALKLAKRFTGRSEIITFKNAYHGSTHGALSVLGDEELKNAFRPLLPDIRIIEFGNILDLEEITNKTACVILEPIQSEGGMIIPTKEFIQTLRARCTEKGALLIFDEVQMGFGRTGKLFAFEHFDVVPDILCLAKAMGGGMPIGAFISDKKILDTFKSNPMLGHITTFGGHPVCCAAAKAALEVLLEENIVDDVQRKGELFVTLLKDHPMVKGFRQLGLFIAVIVESQEIMLAIMKEAYELGVIMDPFLFCAGAFRIAPPLNITDEEIHHASDLLIEAMNKVKK